MVGYTCIIMRVLADWSLNLRCELRHRHLHLIRDGLLHDRRVMDQMDNIGTHRAGLHNEGGGLAIMARMVGMNIRTVGGIGYLRLEVDSQVGGVQIARHGVDWCGS